MPPWIARHLLIPLHEALMGRPTMAMLRRMDASQWWSLERLRGLQQEKLRRLLTHAEVKCPFHRRRIRAAGMDPGAARLENLAGLPLLTKEEIAGNLAEMVEPTIRGGLRKMSTGGSTGSPLAFVTDRGRQAADQAARTRSRRWFGIEPGHRELYLWGSPIELARQDRLKLWRDRWTNHLLLSAFDMTPRAMTRYLDEIRRFDPVHLFGYPSSIATLFGHARRLGRSIHGRSLKAVFVSGESLLPADRAIIEEGVRVPVADGYGSREGGFIAHQCPLGAYHVTMESVIVELIDEAGGPAALGEPGEIVVTHLDALGMPFIRYRTGDLARRAARACDCGRGLECLERIEGRRTDMLRTAAGGYAHALSVIYVLREEAAVSRFKVTQRSNLDLDVDIIPRRRLEATDRERIAKGLRERIGARIEVRINPVAAIPPDPSGKHRCVVSQA